jgi:hypothetical protein
MPTIELSAGPIDYADILLPWARSGCPRRSPIATGKPYADA